MNTVKTSKTMSLLAAVLLAAPVLAQTPTSRPSGDRPMGDRRAPWDRMDRMDNPAGEQGDRTFRPRPSAGREASDEQWEEIVKFMREISPRRTTAYDGMTAPENKRLIRKLVTARYDYLQNIKRDDPTLYEVQVDKTRAEDTIFGILQDAKTSNVQLGDEEKKALREQVEKLVEVNFKEREIRIEKARKSLDEATTRLAEDRKSRDSLVDDRYNQYLREGPRPLKIDRSGREGRPDREREGRGKPESDTEVAAD